MMKTVSFLLLVAGTTLALAVDPCCYPNIFVMGKGTVAGLSVHGKGSSVSSTGTVAFDYLKKLAAEIVSVYEMGKVTEYHVIYNYNLSNPTQFTYDKTSSKCWKTSLPGEMEHCVYANATFYQEMYLGQNQMTADNFGYYVKDRDTEGQVSLSVSQPGCLPGSFIFQGVSRRVAMTSITGYYNFVGSIADPLKYFDIPAACEKALSEDLPDIFAHLGLGL